MTNYVCVELVDMQNGYLACKTWVVWQSPLMDLAITGDQAVKLTASIVSLFMLVKAYKIVISFFKSL